MKKFRSTQEWFEFCEKNPEWRCSSSPGGVMHALGLTRQGVNFCIRNGSLESMRIRTGPDRGVTFVPDFAVRDFLAAKKALSKRKTA